MAIERDTDVKRTANVHALLDTGALALTAVVMRKDTRSRRGGSLAMSALAVAGVLVWGWFGGRLVHEQGRRVKGVSPVQDMPEPKAPGDECIEHAMLAAEKYVPSGGPMLR